MAEGRLGLRVFAAFYTHLPVKTAGSTPDGGTHYVTSGTPVVYTYRVVNSGDAYLTNNVVTDDKLGFIGIIPFLAPAGETYLPVTCCLPVADPMIPRVTCVRPGAANRSRP